MRTVTPPLFARVSWFAVATGGSGVDDGFGADCVDGARLLGPLSAVVVGAVGVVGAGTGSGRDVPGPEPVSSVGVPPPPFPGVLLPPSPGGTTGGTGTTI
jgi:hypothetical protein